MEPWVLLKEYVGTCNAWGLGLDIRQKGEARTRIYGEYMGMIGVLSGLIYGVRLRISHIAT